MHVNENEPYKKTAHIEWIFVILGSGSILLSIVYWILRASSYSYTDVIYLTADYEYGKYFGVAFDVVCGILPVLLIGIPLLLRAFLFSHQKNSQLPKTFDEDASSDDRES
jgi:hypothetical protein